MEWLTEWLLPVLWAGVNSPAGIALVVGAIVVPLIRRLRGFELWRKYEGAIITGIRLAEKSVPGEMEIRGIAKRDEALRYVLRVHREVNDRGATAKEMANLLEGVQIMHNELERSGALKKKRAVRGRPKKASQGILNVTSADMKKAQAAVKATAE